MSPTLIRCRVVLAFLLAAVALGVLLPSRAWAAYPASTCEHFDPSDLRATLGPTVPSWVGGTPPGGYTAVEVRVPGNRKTTAATMRMAITLRRPGGTVDVVTTSQSGTQWRTFGSEGVWSGWTGVASAGYWDKIIGVAIMSTPYSSDADSTQNVLPRKRVVSFGSSSSPVYQQNDPDNCLWWFGDDVRPGTGPLDTPMGPLTTSLDPPPPLTDSTCSAGSFRGVTGAVVGGTLDASWRWSGTVPSRGWEVTDAKPTDGVNAGTVLASVPATELPSMVGRYGLLDWPIPAAPVASLRFRVKGTPACFVSFAVARDANGAATGVTLGGTVPPDTTPDPAPATDEGGANCSMLDVPCYLKFLFVPKPSSWDASGLVASFKSRPPFSIATQGVESVKAFVGIYTDGTCGGLGYWDIANTGSGGQQNGSDVFSCERPTALAVLVGAVQAGLIACTCIILFRMVAEGFKS